jgi:hypothetical protein
MAPKSMGSLGNVSRSASPLRNALTSGMSLGSTRRRTRAAGFKSADQSHSDRFMSLITHWHVPPTKDQAAAVQSWQDSVQDKHSSCSVGDDLTLSHWWPRKVESFANKTSSEQRGILQSCGGH